MVAVDLGGFKEGKDSMVTGESGLESGRTPMEKALYREKRNYEKRK